MLCANYYIRSQVYAGLINFLLRCNYEDAATSDSIVKLRLLLELIEYFGLQKTVLVANGWSHLSRSIWECTGNLSELALSSFPAPHLSFVYGVCCGHNNNTDLSSVRSFLQAKVNEIFENASQLYSRPYFSNDNKQYVISFVENTVKFLYKTCLVDSSQSPTNSCWLFGDDYSGGGADMLKNLGLCGSSITEYLCLNIKNTLSVSASYDGSQFTNSTDQLDSIQHFQNHLTFLCQLLEMSFCRMENFSINVAAKIFYALLSLLTHAATLLTSEQSENFGISNAGLLQIMALKVLSMILQSLNKGYLISTKLQENRDYFKIYQLQLGDVQFAVTLQNAVQTVSRMRPVGAAEFDLMKTNLKSKGLTLSSHDSLLALVVEEYPHFGQYSSAHQFYTWTALSSGLTLLQHHESIQNDNVAMSTVRKLLENACEELELAAMLTVPYIFNSCRLLIHRAYDLLKLNVENDEKFAVIVNCVISRAWAAVMSDDDQVAMQTFISLAFDSPTLQVVGTDIQQVHAYVTSHLL